jgi:hypothetical protein
MIIEIKGHLCKSELTLNRAFYCDAARPDELGYSWVLK